MTGGVSWMEDYEVRTLHTYKKNRPLKFCEARKD